MCYINRPAYPADITGGEGVSLGALQGLLSKVPNAPKLVERPKGESSAGGRIAQVSLRRTSITAYAGGLLGFPPSRL
jgi:hypothetical protein